MLHVEPDAGYSVTALRRGEVMNHGTGFGHKWYKTDAYVNGRASPSLISLICASLLSEYTR